MKFQEIYLKVREFCSDKVADVVDPNYILQILKTQQLKLWSWGVPKFIDMEGRGLFFKVSGNHHKGWVLITLSYDDTFTVRYISNKGEVVDTNEMVYFDDLVDIIDERIEKIPSYKN